MGSTVQVPIRIPADMKDWLAAQARENSSSQNSEVVRAVRERMQRVEEYRRYHQTIRYGENP